MADLFDTALYLVSPGGAACDWAHVEPCECGCVVKEFAVEPRVDRETGARSEKVALRCLDCFAKRPARRNDKVLGWVDTLTRQVTEAPK